MSMKLVVGLGNPGEKYALTRHNIGFMAVDVIINEFNSQNWQQKFNSLIRSHLIENSKVLFIKPLTYMNLSGLAVQLAMNFYRISRENVVVFHDDIDIQLGTVRLKKGGGHGGHNGLKSIIDKVGQDFIRVRIGVSRPENKDVSHYVLSEFSAPEITLLNKSLSKCHTGLSHILKGSTEDFHKLFSNKC